MKRVEKNEEIAKEIEFEKKIKTYKSRAKVIFKILFIGLILIFSFFYYIRFVEPTMLFVKEVKIGSKKIPSSLSGLKIVQFSDLHYQMTTDFKQVEKVVIKINELKPDILVFTGDLLDHTIFYEEEDYTNLTAVLQKIDATISKYYIKGNEDYKNEQSTIILENAGFISLNNRNDQIYGNSSEKIQILGFGSSIQNDFQLDLSFQNIEEDIFTVALFHEPDNIKELRERKIDLALAGHSHNNQIRLPFLSNLFAKTGAKEYNQTYYQIDQTAFFINAGIGTSGNRFRLFAPPTINLYRLVRE